MKSLEDLKKIREAAQSKVAMRRTDNGTRVLVSMGTFGIEAGARAIMNKFVEELSSKNLNNVTVAPTDCTGDSKNVPIVTIVEGKTETTYCKVDEKAVSRILKEHILGGKIVKDYVLGKAKA